MAIASRAAECSQLFDKWVNSSAGDALFIQDMENQIFRFNLWATNNFILAPNKTSMDWRLRSAPLLESTMVELLDDLKASLVELSALPYHLTTPIGMQDQDQTVFHAVSEALDALFRLSRAIRRSGILRRFVKVGSYVEYDENGVNLTEEFRKGAERIVEFRLKGSKVSEELRKRIIDTICLRQQHFSYLKGKKAKNTPIYQSHQSTPKSTLSATFSVTGFLTSKAPGKIERLPRVSKAGPSIMTATTVQPNRMPNAYSVKSTNEKITHDVDCSDADIPLPPKVSNDRKESECPYCFLACSTEELSGRRWKSHIIQDLMPYICILEPCRTPTSLFESGKDWLGHMRSQHAASRWTCMDNTHDTILFLQSEDKFKDHMRTAAARAKDITSEYDLHPSITPKLVTLALYDFAILCDDSSSMNSGNRIQTLEDTCYRVAQIATFLQPQGIFLRFLNYEHDRHFNDLVNEDDIKSKVEGVRYQGLTRLGTVLRNKIVQGLIFDKITSNQFKRPLITIIITDGCPTGENQTELEDTILQCKKGLDQYHLKPASAVFLISRVGNDDSVEEFLNSLKKNETMKKMLYCYVDQLDYQRDVFRRAGKDKRYTSFLINLFVAALDSQTSN